MKKIVTVGLSPAVQKVIRIPNFSVGEVNRSIDYLTDAAGKSINVGRVLTQAGVDAVCLVPVGIEGKSEFLTLCDRDKIPLVPVFVSGRIRVAYTLVDLDKVEVTEVVVNEPEIASPEEELLMRRYIELIGENTRAVVVSGSRLPGFSPLLIPFFLREAKKRNLPYFADYKNDDLHNSFISRAERPDFVKINETELFQTFPEVKALSLEESLMQLSGKYGNTFVISRGADSICYAANGVFGELESERVEAVNPIGCGDALMAGLVEGITSGLSLRDSVLKGRIYASRNAESYHPGWIKGEE